MGCGVDRRCDSDLALLWLWQRPAVVAPIRRLAWEPPCALTGLRDARIGGKRLFLGVSVRVRWTFGLELADWVKKMSSPVRVGISESLNRTRRQRWREFTHSAWGWTASFFCSWTCVLLVFKPMDWGTGLGRAELSDQKKHMSHKLP